MCGAFACTAADVDAHPGARLRASVAYHLARLAGYLAIGAVAGAAGAAIDSSVPWSVFGRPAAVAAGAILVAWGLARALAQFGVHVPWAGTAFGATLAAGVLRRGTGGSPLVRAMLLGLIAPLLPCGWLYAFVAPAAASGSAWNGALVMAAFWMGTVPALAAIAAGLHRAFGPARRALPLVTAVALIAVGAMTIARATRTGAPPAHVHDGNVRR
jgi:hypothetical protein